MYPVPRNAMTHSMIPAIYQHVCAESMINAIPRPNSRMTRNADASVLRFGGYVSS